MKKTILIAAIAFPAIALTAFFITSPWHLESLIPLRYFEDSIMRGDDEFKKIRLIKEHLNEGNGTKACVLLDKIKTPDNDYLVYLEVMCITNVRGITKNFTPEQKIYLCKQINNNGEGLIFPEAILKAASCRNTPSTENSNGIQP